MAAFQSLNSQLNCHLLIKDFPHNSSQSFPLCLYPIIVLQPRVPGNKLTQDNPNSGVQFITPAGPRQSPQPRNSTSFCENLIYPKCMLLLLLLSHFSRVRLCATPQTAAHQAPQSLGFSRQQHWSGVPLPSPSLSVCFPETSLNKGKRKIQSKLTRDSYALSLGS